MKLDKAIEIKERTGEEFLNTDPDEIDEADRLSIEALKVYKKSQEAGWYPPGYKLPGETEA